MSLLGEYVLPYVEDVAGALARKCGWTIRADGDINKIRIVVRSQVLGVSH